MPDNVVTSAPPHSVSSAPPESEVAQRARRRIARRLLPFLFVLYVIAFIDRMNVGAAALQMPRDLGFSEGVIGFGAGIFFFGYFLLEIPGALIVERWGARRIYPHRAAILSRTFLRGSRRGWIFPRCHCLFDPLVPLPGSGEGGRSLLCCESYFLHYRFPAGGIAARDLMAWAEGMAVAVHHRRDPRGLVRNHYHFLSHGLAQKSAMASCR